MCYVLSNIFIRIPFMEFIFYYVSPIARRNGDYKQINDLSKYCICMYLSNEIGAIEAHVIKKKEKLRNENLNK